jgi:uncharacterized protein YndB with AHSA1/START domain
MTTEISPLHVRRSIWIKAAPDRVWKEFETYERMAAWFGTGHRLVAYEPHIGGHVELEIEGEFEGRSRWGGKVVAYDPPYELTFEDTWIPDLGWDAPMLFTFRLTPYGDGTMVELLVHNIERIGEGAAEHHAGYEGGWTNRQLKMLREIVEGSRA